MNPMKTSPLFLITLAGVAVLLLGCVGVTPTQQTIPGETDQGIILTPKAPEISIKRTHVAAPLRIVLAPEVKNDFSFDYSTFEMKFTAVSKPRFETAW